MDQLEPGDVVVMCSGRHYRYTTEGSIGVVWRASKGQLGPYQVSVAWVHLGPKGTEAAIDDGELYVDIDGRVKINLGRLKINLANAKTKLGPAQMFVVDRHAVQKVPKELSDNLPGLKVWAQMYIASRGGSDE